MLTLLMAVMLGIGMGVLAGVMATLAAVGDERQRPAPRTVDPQVIEMLRTRSHDAQKRARIAVR